MTTSKSDAVVLCVDGSDLAVEAARAGLAILQPAERVVVATVVEAGDPYLVSGAGMAGGVMSADEFDELDRAFQSEGREIVERATAAIGVPDADVTVLRGDAGSALCKLAAELPARVLVMGSRGRSGLKRAVLGSVSDYVVRNAPCPVVISRTNG
jgi:nucleotide-binding universal stress UspA family protein